MKELDMACLNTRLLGLDNGVPFSGQEIRKQHCIWEAIMENAKQSPKCTIKSAPHHRAKT